MTKKTGRELLAEQRARLNEYFEWRLAGDPRAVEREKAILADLMDAEQQVANAEAHPATEAPQLKCSMQFSFIGGKILGFTVGEYEKTVEEWYALAGGEPVPRVLTCPKCGAGHEDTGEWATRPHKTHLCLLCAHEWRPFNYPTVGIAPKDDT